jgi:hypothetical protein
LNVMSEIAASSPAVLVPSIEMSSAAIEIQICDGITNECDDIDEKIKLFFEERSKTWMYDWMLDLEEWERFALKGSSASRSLIRTNCYDVVDTIRDRLHQLQKKMPCWILLTAIAERASKVVLTAVEQDDEVFQTESDESIGEMSHNIYESMKGKNTCTESSWSAIQERIDRQRLILEVQKCVREEHRKQRVDKVASFVKAHVLLLLETLYADIGVEEQLLSEDDGEVDPCRAYFRALYAVPEDGSAASSAKTRVRLIGPLGERPLHICMFRADEWKGRDAVDGLGAGVSRGVLDAVTSFIEHGRWPREIDTLYGKDYCAAVGSYLRRRESNPAPHAPAPWEHGMPSGGRPTRPTMFSRRGVAWGGGGGQFTAPAWTPLLEWSRGPAGQDCGWAWMGWAGGARQGDLEALVTSGLYEGESALLFMIAARNEDMVAWILRRSTRSGLLVHGHVME